MFLLLWRRQQQGVISKFKCRLMFCFIFLCCGTVSILSKGVAKLEMHWFAVVMSYRLLVTVTSSGTVMEFLRGVGIEKYTTPTVFKNSTFLTLCWPCAAASSNQSFWSLLLSRSSSPARGG